MSDYWRRESILYCRVATVPEYIHSYCLRCSTPSLGAPFAPSSPCLLPTPVGSFLTEWYTEYEWMLNEIEGMGYAYHVKTVSFVFSGIAHASNQQRQEQQIPIQDLWPNRKTFKFINRLTVVAQPSVLRSFLGQPILSFEEQLHDHMHLHLLSLHEPHATRSAIWKDKWTRQDHRPKIYQWDDVLVNERTSIFGTRGPPRYASDLCRVLQKNPLERISSIMRTNYPRGLKSTRSFTYTSIYPWYEHVVDMFRRVADHASVIRFKLPPDTEGGSGYPPASQRSAEFTTVCRDYFKPMWMYLVHTTFNFES